MESNLRMVAAPCVERKRQMTMRNTSNDIDPPAIRVCLSINEKRLAGTPLPASNYLLRGCLDLKAPLANHDYRAVQPPSMKREVPVTKEDASDARKTMAPVSSSSSPHRP